MPDEIIIVAIRMEKELLYWVFSTIVQAFVALLLLVGIYQISTLEWQKEQNIKVPRK